MATKKASIKYDDIKNTSLDRISAADFISALDSNRLQLVKFLPEKKKFELEVEPVWKIPVEHLLDKLKGEKKKTEREIPDFFGEVMNDRVTYDRFVNDVVSKLSKELKR